MALTVTEAFDSGRLTTGRGKGGEIRFIVSGAVATDTETDVAAAVEQAAPATLNGMASRSITVSRTSDNYWEATASYQPSEYMPPAESSIVNTTFQVATDRQSVQMALAQTAYSLRTDLAAPPHGLLVNVDSNGIAQGVEVDTPRFEWSETHYISSSTIPGTNNAWIAAAVGLAGKLNNATFRGFAPRSVLFLGASGRQRPEEGDWEIDFRFSALPGGTVTLPRYNAAGQQDGTQVITKGGWDYIWFWTREYADQPTEGTGSGATYTRADAVYVAQVYASGDFSAVIPTPSTAS